MGNVHAHDWVVYAKQPLGGPAQVLEYLARYTHRVSSQEQGNGGPYQARVRPNTGESVQTGHKNHLAQQPLVKARSRKPGQHRAMRSNRAKNPLTAHTARLQSP